MTWQSRVVVSCYTIVVAAGLAACGREAPEPAKLRGGSPKATPRPDGGLTPADALPERARAMAGPDAGASKAFAWLPKDSLVVVRVPLRGAGNSLLAETGLARALAGLDLQDFKASLRTLATKFGESIAQQFPEGSQLWDAVQALEGEAVLALVSVDPGRGGRLPVVLGAHIELGTQEDTVLQVLRALAKRRAGGLAETSPGRFQAAAPYASVDVLVAGGWLSAAVTPTSVKDRLGEWRALAPERSFLAADVRKTRPPDEPVLYEVYLNLAPAWALVRSSAPAQVRDVIAKLRLPGISGLSLVTTVVDAGFHTQIQFNAAAHEDVVSRMFEGPGLDSSWADYVFEGADSAWVASVDVGSALRAVNDLTSGKRGPSAQPVSHPARGAPDPFAAFGPHFVVAMRGDLAGALLAGGSFEASLVVEVNDAAIVQAMLDRALGSTGVLAARTARKVGTAEAWSVPLPLPGVPRGLELTYGIVGNALVASTSPDVFAKTLRAHELEGKAMPASLRQVIAERSEDTRVVGIQSVFAQVQALHTLLGAAIGRIGGEISGDGSEPASRVPLPRLPAWEDVARAFEGTPDDVMVVRRIDAGVRFDSHGTLPNLLSAGAPLAIVAAVAIPNLLSARLEANEKAAIATLRNMASAQAQFQAMAAADRDRDGIGEYGFLSELAGASPLPNGRPLEPPVLSASLGRVTGGAVQKSGYLFSVYVAGRDGAPVAELQSGGAPAEIDPDAAELAYVIYAWPVQAGSTGLRVFVIDETGEFLTTRNTGAAITYSGREAAPAPDAAMTEPRRITTRTPSVTRRGQDGRTWQRLD